MLQMWKEFKSTISCELPDAATFSKTWESLVAKMHAKANIETEREKVTEKMKKHKEECSIISDEEICKYKLNVKLFYYWLCCIFEVKEINGLQGLELLECFLAPRTKCSLVRRFEVYQLFSIKCPLLHTCMNIAD